jgi:hydrogenase/urease accessory protein HupE
MTRRLNVFLVWLLCIFPGPALAHTPIKGVNNFFNGVLHPVLVPAHLLLLIAAGLFFGQRLEEIHSAVKLSIAAVVLGLGAASFSPGIPQLEVLILASAAIIGLLVAADLRIPLYWYPMIGVTAGFMLGLDSTQDTLSGKEKFVALFGSGVGIYFFSIYPIGVAEYCSKKSWQRIGVRVIGSWIAASALLVLALSLSTVMK